MDLSKIWPDWSIVRLIGEGSFGKVYEIMRNNFGIEEHCALKVITIPSSKAELQSVKNDGMDDDGATEYFKGLVEEFVQEIAVMSKLKGNVNIVGYEDYAIVEHKDSFGWDILIRMELLTDLPSLLRKGTFTQKDVVKLAIDLCSALETCHKQKIIHRDIKPDNIFIDQFGNYKLGDFGVARTIEKTISGLSKKGTYTYMAPEVYKSEEYGFDVDIYSLGIVMYRLLNNNREPFLPPYPNPIKFNDKNEALVRRMSGEMILPLSGVSPELNAIILKACSFNSSERYRKPRQMKDDLMAIDVSILKNIAYEDNAEIKNDIQNEDVPEDAENFNVADALADIAFNRSDNSQDNNSVAQIVCPACGTVADEDDNFCLKCGNKLLKISELNVVDSKAAESSEDDNRIACKYCGAINDSDDNFCLKCGNKLV